MGDRISMVMDLEHIRVIREVLSSYLEIMDKGEDEAEGYLLEELNLRIREARFMPNEYRLKIEKIVEYLVGLEDTIKTARNEEDYKNEEIEDIRFYNGSFEWK